MTSPMRTFVYRNCRVGIYPKTVTGKYMALVWYKQNDQPLHGCFDLDPENIVIRVRQHIDILLDVIREENLTSVLAHSFQNRKM